MRKFAIVTIRAIVFADTNTYHKSIDKRVPFRNHILHNGIVEYSDEEVEMAYELLVKMIGILLLVDTRIKKD